MTLLRELRFAARSLRKSPLSSCTAVASLALGIGAVVSVAALANGLFLQPLPGIADADRLATVQLVAGDGERVLGASYPEYRQLAGSAAGFAGLVAWSDHPLAYADGGEAELLLGQAVSGNYFRVLGVRPAVGRFFTPGETTAPGGAALAVLSYSLWHQRFAADPAAVGRTVSLNGFPFTVVGVAPESFRGLFRGFRFDVWTPLAMAEVVEPNADLADPEAEWLEMAVRLPPGMEIPQAEGKLSALLREVRRQRPGAIETAVVVRPATGFDEFLRRAAIGLSALLGAVALLVLVAVSANVANLLLARVAGQGREIAVRLATGAGRRHVVRHLLAESLLLAGGGALAGLLLAAWASDLLRLFQPPPPLAIDLQLPLDGRVLLVALATALLMAVLTALTPALRIARVEVVEALRRGSGGPQPSRARRAFVVAQVAVSLMLLVVAGLLLRTLHHAASAEVGMETRWVEAAVLDGSLLRLDAAEAASLYDRLEAQALELPGVEAAALAGAVPLSLGGPPATVVGLPGRQPPPGEEGFTVRWTAVSPEYFETVGTGLLVGRSFVVGDRMGSADVAVVSRTLAESFWPGESALEKRLLWQGREVRVVGVAADTAVRGLGEPSTPLLYLPFAQRPALRTHLLVRRAEGAPPLAPAMRRLVRREAPALPLTLLLPLADLQGLALLPQRVAGGAAGSLGLLALLVAAVGLGGNVAYLVSRRTREIGVRMALGARRADVLRMVVRQGLSLALAGIAVGLFLALATTRLLAGLLYGVNPTDPLTFGLIALFLVAVALAASYLPARRAASVDPVAALKSE